MDERRRTYQVIEETLRLIPDLDPLIMQLEQEPQTVLNKAFPDGLVDPGDPADRLPDVGGRMRERASAASPAEAIQHAHEALLLIRRDGINARLEPRHHDSLEAVILPTERPTFLLHAGQFTLPADQWSILDGHRTGIAETARRVGRVQMRSSRGVRALGTGFLVAEKVVMTNRHVIELFGNEGPDATWSFKPGIQPNIDPADDPDMRPGATFAIERVIADHPDKDIDLALLQLADAPRDSAGVITPLIMASEGPRQAQGRLVYVVGYPLNDPHHDPVVLRSVFGDRFGIKRLQPGEILAVFEGSGMFNHDCSTLGGNSGSCVVDLETNRVIGLHYKGLQGQWNQAVSLWPLRNDPLLRSVGVHFA